MTCNAKFRLALNTARSELSRLARHFLSARRLSRLAFTNKEQLVTFVKFVHPETGKANTAFLAASNLLGNSSSADAEAITNAIVAQLEDAGIDKKKLSNFSSDGASVMTGKRNGFGARLRVENKALINIHCI